MATITDNQPEEDHIQGDYDNRFNDIVGAEKAADPSFGDEPKILADSTDPERSLFNPHADGGLGSALKNKAVNSLADKAAGGAAAGGATAAAGAVTGGAGAVASIALKSAVNKVFTRGNGKKAAVGGGIAGTVLILALVASTSVPTLFLKHFAENVRNSAYANVNNAIQNQTQNLFEHYVAQKVLPGYTSCGSTISKDCTAVKSPGNDLVSQLYNTWADQKLENKLAEKYDLTFEFDKSSGNWTIRSGGKVTKIGPKGEGLTKPNRLERAEFRRAALAAIDSETGLKRMIIRFKIGRLVDSKYGGRRCYVLCKTTQKIETKVADQKKYYQRQIIKRVIEPRYSMMGSGLVCTFDSECHPEKADVTSGDAPTNGAKESKFSGEIRGINRAAIELASKADTEALAAAEKQLAEEGFSKTFIKLALAKVFPKAAASASVQSAVDSIPIIGWIVMLTQLFHTALDTGDKMQAMSYQINAQSTVAVWSLTSSAADEMGHGSVPAAVIGSMSNGIINGVVTDPSAPVDGGTGKAAQNPTWSAVINRNESSGRSKDYTCGNEKPVPSNRLDCEELVMGSGNKYATAISSFRDSPMYWLGPVLADWTGLIISKIISIPGALIEKLGIMEALDATCKSGPTTIITGLFTGGTTTAYCTAQAGIQAIISKVGPPLIEFMATYMFSPIVTANMSGSRMVSANVAGAETLANDYAHSGIGGQVLSEAQSALIKSDDQEQAKYEFRQQPFFARMFNTSSPYSMASSLVDGVPPSWAQAGNKAASALVSPLEIIGSVFGSLTQPHVNALNNFSVASTYGITSYGYPSDSPVFSQDPSALWNDPGGCAGSTTSATTTAWNDAGAAAVDANGQPVNTTTNACLLTRAAISAAGGKYNTDLLTDDDKKVLFGDSGSSAAPAGTGKMPTGSAQEIAKQLLPYIEQSKLVCVGTQGPTCPDIQKTATGQSIRNVNCRVDALKDRTVGMLLGLLQAGHTFKLSSICSDHLRNTDAGHGGGYAVDFNTIDGVFMGQGDDKGLIPFTQQQTDADRKLTQGIVNFVPAPLGFGQGVAGRGYPNCHYNNEVFSFLSPYSQFGDACHHQHVSVDGH